ncbi:MAG: hypothetical protein HY651_03770 [Acidobacteria bacterium]|nr:hypothetical protein [Acidobacteriota bacterium]
MASKNPSVFAYIISTVGKNYQLTGCVPWVTQGKVFFGPCKKKMRPLVRPGDYVMGISPAGIGEQRRVLLWMEVAERMTFAEAYERGRKDKYFLAARRHAIHVRPRKDVKFEPGNPLCYEHIPNAPHRNKWSDDLKGNRDVFLVGAKGSWVAQESGPSVDQELFEMLQEGIRWGRASLQNPLTENPRGKHAHVMGETVQEILSWLPKMKKTVLSSDLRNRTVCIAKCPCD